MLAQSAPRDAALADAGTAESATIYQGLTPQRMARIQRALQRDKLDGWLFFDFRRSDEIAYRLLGLDPGGARSRRWYCLVPVQGQPRKLLHAIEPRALDGVPGSSATYTSWRTRDRELGTLLRGVRRVAMRSEERTSELQSRLHLVCRLLLEKKKNTIIIDNFSSSPRSEGGLSGKMW